MISTARIHLLSIADCEEILYACDKALMLGTTAPEEMTEVRDLVRERYDHLRKASDEAS